MALSLSSSSLDNIWPSGQLFCPLSCGFLDVTLPGSPSNHFLPCSFTNSQSFCPLNVCVCHGPVQHPVLLILSPRAIWSISMTSTDTWMWVIYKLIIFKTSFHSIDIILVLFSHIQTSIHILKIRIIYASYRKPGKKINYEGDKIVHNLFWREVLFGVLPFSLFFFFLWYTQTHSHKHTGNWVHFITVDRVFCFFLINLFLAVLGLRFCEGFL